MWILECDGDALRRRRVWLRPGKKYLFGRTREEGISGFVIAHKSVSRKHLTLAVSAPKPGDGNRVHARSELSLEDERTKVGTEIDGVKVKGEKRILKNDEHVFRLGSSDQVFRIKWQPVVLSFTFPAKEIRPGKDPLASTRGRLEDLDIKTTILYIVDSTTHVVSGKRNTAKCLQALINGKFIVDDSFIDALIYVTTPGNLDEPESLSPLEEDFDKNWPRANNYLPAPSKEPNQRPPDLFAPDAARAQIFESYTFIFCDSRQFENLQAPITNGGGKALFLEVASGKTKAADIVRYYKEVSGEKDSEAGIPDSEDGNVMLIRFQGEKGHEDWATDVQREVAMKLNRQLIEQNEFLDVILINDPSKLRRRIVLGDHRNEVVHSDSQRPSAAPGTQNSSKNDAQASAQPSQSMRRTRPRGTVQSAFKGFDDGFDRLQVQSQKKSFNAASQNGDRIIHDDSEVEPVTARSNKRPAPSEDEENDRMDDDLLPAAAAMKRRRIEQEKEAKRNGVPLGPVFGASKTKDSNEAVKKTKPAKEINIQEAVRERRKAEEEEAAGREETDLHQIVSDMTVDEMKQLAVVEEMDLPTRSPSLRNGTNGHLSDRWDERWNGRKNFKKFRRQGEARPARRGQTVIVPLEEVKRKSQGIGEQYWLESASATATRRQQQEREARAAEQEQRENLEDDNRAASQSLTFASAHSHQQDEVPAEFADGVEQSVVDVDAPQSTRSSDRNTSQAEGHNTFSTNRSRVPDTAGSKRSAPGGSRDSAAVKRQKTLPVAVAVVQDSDSEDGLKFRFKKKR